MSVLLIMEAVVTTVIILLVHTTALAILDINYTQTNINVKVRIYPVYVNNYIPYVCMYIYVCTLL